MAEFSKRGQEGGQGGIENRREMQVEGGSERSGSGRDVNREREGVGVSEWDRVSGRTDGGHHLSKPITNSADEIDILLDEDDDDRYRASSSGVNGGGGVGIGVPGRSPEGIIDIKAYASASSAGRVVTPLQASIRQSPPLDQDPVPATPSSRSPGPHPNAHHHQSGSAGPAYPVVRNSRTTKSVTGANRKHDLPTTSNHHPSPPPSRASRQTNPDHTSSTSTWIGTSDTACVDQHKPAVWTSENENENPPIPTPTNRDTRIHHPNAIAIGGTIGTPGSRDQVREEELGRTTDMGRELRWEDDVRLGRGGGVTEGENSPGKTAEGEGERDGQGTIRNDRGNRDGSRGMMMEGEDRRFYPPEGEEIEMIHEPIRIPPPTADPLNHPSQPPPLTSTGAESILQYDVNSSISGDHINTSMFPPSSQSGSIPSFQSAPSTGATTFHSDTALNRSRSGRRTRWGKNGNGNGGGGGPSSWLTRFFNSNSTFLGGARSSSEIPSTAQSSAAALNSVSSQTRGGGGRKRPGTADSKASGTSSVAVSVGPYLGVGVEGYEDDELTRDYDFWASFSVAFSNIGFLPGAFFGFVTSSTYGGSSMLAIAWPISGIFMCILAAVLAEMASTYPVCGAMFTWTFKLCRLHPTLRNSARFISWIAGSFLLCGHVLCIVIVCWQISTALQGAVLLYAQDYVPDTWKTIFIFWAALLFCALIVASPMSRSPIFWKMCASVILATFLITNIGILVASNTRRPLREVFTSYTNNSGWSSPVVVYLLGWVGTTLASGADASAHIAEETKSPARNVPMAIFWSTFVSYCLGWISLLVFLSCVVNSDTMQSMKENATDIVPQTHYFVPGQLLLASLGRPLAFAILFMTLLAMIVQSVAQILASSRFIWALARDSALPMSKFLRVVEDRRLPRRAIWFVVSISAPIALLVAIDQSIVTVLVFAGAGFTIFLAYILPIAVYIGCESGCLNVDGRNLWTLRGWSKPMAWVSIVFVALILVMESFPSDLPIDAVTAPWSPVIGFGVLILSCLSWIFYGNTRYAGPIKSMTRWTIGREVELPKSSTFRSASTNAHGPDTTSAAVGKSAKIFLRSLPTLNSIDQAGAGIYDDDTRMHDLETGRRKKRSRRKDGATVTVGTTTTTTTTAGNETDLYTSRGTGETSYDSTEWTDSGDDESEDEVEVDDRADARAGDQIFQAAGPTRTTRHRSSFSPQPSP